MIRNANQIVKTVMIQHGDYPLLITGILRCNFRIIGAIHDYDYVGDFDGIWWWNHVGWIGANQEVDNEPVTVYKYLYNNSL